MALALAAQPASSAATAVVSTTARKGLTRSRAKATAATAGSGAEARARKGLTAAEKALLLIGTDSEVLPRPSVGRSRSRRTSSSSSRSSRSSSSSKGRHKKNPLSPRDSRRAGAVCPFFISFKFRVLLLFAICGRVPLRLVSASAEAAALAPSLTWSQALPQDGARDPILRPMIALGVFPIRHLERGVSNSSSSNSNTTTQASSRENLGLGEGAIRGAHVSARGSTALVDSAGDPNQPYEEEPGGGGGATGSVSGGGGGSGDNGGDGGGRRGGYRGGGGGIGGSGGGASETHTEAPLTVLRGVAMRGREHGAGRQGGNGGVVRKPRGKEAEDRRRRRMLQLQEQLSPPPSPPPPPSPYRKVPPDLQMTGSAAKTDIDRSARVVTLTLDQMGLGAVATSSYFFHGLFSVNLKLPSGNTTGVVSTFYLMSKGSRDSIDFAFIGSADWSTVRVHTNFAVGGVGGRTEQFNLWFDPSVRFHTYMIQWSWNVIRWYVDGTPIRETFLGSPSRSLSSNVLNPLALRATIWAQDWSPSGVDWSSGPFDMTLTDIDYKRALNATNGIPPQGMPGLQHKWDRKLNKRQQRLMWTVRRKYMVYSYLRK